MKALVFAVAFLLTCGPVLADESAAVDPFHDAAFSGGAVGQPNRFNVAHGAPADKYFGIEGLSVLGIRNRLQRVAWRLDSSAASEAGDLIGDVSRVEDAMREWETQYPSDSWLPRMLLALHQVYSRIGGEQSIRHAVDVAAWLIAKYPQSREADLVRAAFAQPGAVSAR